MKISLPAQFQNVTFEGDKGLFLVRESCIDGLKQVIEENNPFEVTGRTARGSVTGFQTLSGEAFVIRRYVHGGLLGTVLNEIHWGLGRALEELAVSEKAIEKGLKTPQIVAIRCQNILGPFWRLDLVTRKLENVRPLEELLREDVESATQRSLIDKVAEIVRSMHEVGLWHADLHIRNLLVQEGVSPKDEQVYIVDLDRSRMHSSLTPGKAAQNLYRLNRSIEKFTGDGSGLTTADRMRFLKAYLGHGQPVRTRQWMKECARHLRRHRFWWKLTGKSL